MVYVFLYNLAFRVIQAMKNSETFTNWNDQKTSILSLVILLTLPSTLLFDPGKCLHQLSFSDVANHRDSHIYKLAHAVPLSVFKVVVLVSSAQVETQQGWWISRVLFRRFITFGWSSDRPVCCRRCLANWSHVVPLGNVPLIVHAHFRCA